VPSLVALDMPAGAAFVAALRTVWDAGDAAFVVDRRLSRASAAALFEAVAPGAVVGEDGRRRALNGGRPAEPGDALVIATSGTGGTPKGVVLTHDALLRASAASSERLDIDPGSDRWLACLPLAHIGGLGVVVRALHVGTGLVVHPGFDARAVEEEARRGATLVSLVPTAAARTDLSGFRRVLVGGARPHLSLPANAIVTYGMTETAGGVVYDGRPLCGVEVRIGDGELGEPGEVLVRGPMLLRAYRDGSDPLLPGSWLPTGDGGHLEPDGSLVVEGRLADVIVTGGEKVWPATVEAALVGHPKVDEALVYGRPDPEWGSTVVAAIVPRDPADPPELDELRAVVRSSVAPWAAPRILETVPSLARTSSGKLQRAPRSRPTA
jgi:o-succinylbenzoate---CoA ligase